MNNVSLKDLKSLASEGSVREIDEILGDNLENVTRLGLRYSDVAELNRYCAIRSYEVCDRGERNDVLASIISKGWGAEVAEAASDPATTDENLRGLISQVGYQHVVYIYRNRSASETTRKLCIVECPDLRDEISQ